MLRRGLLIVVAVVAVLALVPAAIAAAHALRRPGRPAPPVLQARLAYAGLVHDFGSPDALFREGDGTYAQAWPFSQALAAAIAIAELPGSADEREEVRLLVESLPAYFEGGAYDSTIAPPYGGGGTQFFDDNEWLAFDLLEASAVLRDPTLVTQAQGLFSWVVAGWDANPGDPCSGGIFWAKSASIQDRNTVSTANAALLAVQLYGVTHQAAYLQWAERLYGWVNGCLGDRDGLYFDHVDGSGQIDERKWSYNQGAMVATAALLYRATGDRTYLRQASSVASAALAHYAASAFAGEPSIFVAIFFRDLAVLNGVQPHPEFAAALAQYVAAGESSAPSSGSDVLDRAAAVQLAAELVPR